MPIWVDLRSQGLTLLAQYEPTGTGNAIRALVIRPLRPDATPPVEAIAYGFARQGNEFVRVGADVVLPEIQGLFPGSALVDLPEAAIVYRRSATIVNLHRGGGARTMPPVEAPPGEWTRIPLPRFQLEASTAWVNGYLLVLHGKHEFQTQRRNDPAAAKAEAHRDAISRALATGAELSCEVLVDYVDLAYWGAQHGRAAIHAAHLLARLGVAEKLLAAENGVLLLQHPTQPALRIAPVIVGDSTYLAFTLDGSGKPPTNAQGDVVFEIRNGRLFLAGTATPDGADGRGFDAGFANTFLQRVLADGYDMAKVSWPDAVRNRHPAYSNDVQRLSRRHGATIVPIMDGQYVGLYMAIGPDAQGHIQSAMGISAHAAITALVAHLAGEPPQPMRQLGLNIFREMLIEDGAGRHRLTQAGPITELVEIRPRGVEFMTVAEGMESMALGRKSGRPTLGAWLFGRPIARVIPGQDGRPVYFAIETNGSIQQVHSFVPHRATQGWECVSRGRAGDAEPTDAELQAIHAHGVRATFDSDAFLAEVNAAIRASNQGLVEANQLPELPADQVAVIHPNTTTYLLQYKDPLLPMQVMIQADVDDLWRVCTSESESYPGTLSSVCSAAAGMLADARMHYLRRLHRGDDDRLRIGLPRRDFDVLHRVLRGTAPRDAMPAAAMLPRERISVQEVSNAVLRLAIQDTPLAYEVFVLALDPNATISNYERDGVHSVAQLVAQIQDDLAWTEALAGRQDAATLQAWVERYLRLQVRHYGEEHLVRVPSATARALALALADRDEDVLMRIVGRVENSNAAADRLFELVAERLLGDGTPARQAAIRAYCGRTAAAAADIAH